MTQQLNKLNLSRTSGKKISCLSAYIFKFKSQVVCLAFIPSPLIPPHPTLSYVIFFLFVIIFLNLGLRDDGSCLGC